MSDDRYRQLGMIGTLVFSGIVWYFVFTVGFFITLTWLIVISAILGLWLRLTGRR